MKLTKEQIAKRYSDDIQTIIEAGSLVVTSDINFGVSHPDDETALIHITVPVKEAFCQYCSHWHTNERYMETYGEGMGMCSVLQEPKAGTHGTCMRCVIKSKEEK